MSLSCSCSDYEPEDPGDWWYFIPVTLASSKPTGVSGAVAAMS